MGYTTDFHGSFQLDHALSAAQVAYLKAFADTRRMKRDVDITEFRPDPVRHAVVLPLGLEGGFFVGEGGVAGQGEEHYVNGKYTLPKGVVDYNCPPSDQPGLWCQWTPNEDGTEIEWDGGEKFYNYVEWLKYLIKNFLAPWGYSLNGEVQWSGEESGDLGIIVVKNNKVTTKRAKITFELEDDDHS